MSVIPPFNQTVYEVSFGGGVSLRGGTFDSPTTSTVAPTTATTTRLPSVPYLNPWGRLNSRDFTVSDRR